ncbi:MAG: TIGR00725 family protein [Solirubrobacteraceae bacterium]
MSGAPYIAIVGPSEAEEPVLGLAFECGRMLAAGGAVVVCGGLGGVMDAACRGVHESGGMTVGLLPGFDRSAANPHLTVAIATGLGELRNGLVVRAADAVIGVGGSFGTLSELALARRIGTPVVLLGGWRVHEASGASAELGVRVRTAPRAVAVALAAARARAS